ncbi:putative beta-hexosaminidase [Ylistrum balloti]|uniref:putative beta-hexosaminidase n=1 Tax=Ylistrum balloti TaxID=509963 RepID=UPI002905E7E3|nr:putative beta-hexosaminidase [Ylistrum balloti]
MEDLQSRGPVLLLLLVTLVCTASANVADLAKRLEAKYELINHNPGGTYYASIILTNVGNIPIDATGGWSLNFCHENIVEFERFNRSTEEYLPTRRGGFILSHISGCLYKFTPDPQGFQAIGPNQTRRITFLSPFSISGIFDVYPNIYLADNTQSAVISNTRDTRLFVAPFKNIFQYTRHPPTDPILPVSPIRSYAVLANQSYPALQPGDIIPTPLLIRSVPSNRKVFIDSSWMFYSGTNSPQVVELMSYFQKTLDIPVSTTPKQSDVIAIGIVSDVPSFVENSDEWYNITVSATFKYVNIVAKTTHGLLNGFQTLLNLLEVKVKPDNTRVFEVPEIMITDSPRFKHRALLLDVASNFFPLPTLEKLLRIMALVKLNKLHLLLANDYGARLEITSIPGFHIIASKRCHDETEESCLSPQFGSDPSGNGVGSGFYTATEYKMLLSIAKQLHIEIIPTWNFDSNMRASEIAMRAYSKATNDNTMNWSLPVLDKTSEVKPNLFRLGKVDPCAVETERFIRTIISTIRSYHTDAGYPLKTFGIGGDDTDIDAWLTKCRVRNKINRPGNPYVHRKLEFNQMLAKIAVENDVTLNAYDNQFTAFPTTCFNSTECTDWFTPYDLKRWMPNTFRASVTHREPTVMTLTRLRFKNLNVSELGPHDAETKMRMFQRNGYSSIISLQDVLDFTIKEEPGPYVPGEMPLGRSPIPLQHVYSMWPEALCCNRYECNRGAFSYRGRRIPLCVEDVNAPGPIGMQAFLSTRKVRTESNLFLLLFPRLIAFAERAWHRASWENTIRRPIRNLTAAGIAEVHDFQKFKAILGTKLLPTMDKYKAIYYMAPPGAIMRNVTTNVNDQNRAVSAHTEFPGFVAQIKTDKMPDFEDIVNNKIYSIQHAEFRTRNAQSTRFSRSEVVLSNFTDKYAREHMEMMSDLAETSVLEYPIQTTLRNQDDPSGLVSFAIRPELPLYFDREFGRFFNRTGFQAFTRIRPTLVQQAMQNREQHMRMMEAHRRFRDSKSEDKSKRTENSTQTNRQLDIKEQTTRPKRTDNSTQTNRQLDIKEQTTRPKRTDNST